MTIPKIETALRTAFNSGGFFAAGNTGFENESLTPTPGTPWAQVFVVDSSSDAATQTTTGLDEHNGFLQVDLNYPLNQGTGAINAKAEAIRAAFKPGTRVSYDGQDVQFRNFQMTPGGEVNGWWRKTLTLFWSARTQR